MTDALTELRRALGERFAVERLLGQGGMGAVYLARDRQLDRPVALKVLPAEFALQHDLRERFLRETRTAASFSHPNIVPVFSVEDHGSVLAYSMGYVEGESLAQQVARSGPLSVRDTVRMLQDVAYALAYAHGRGVVHRDIKPDNIMIERATGRALLSDVVHRCLAKSPDERFAAAEQLVEALDVSALRGVEIPLPIRLFAQDVAQAGMVLAFSVIVLVLLYAVLAVGDRSDLDVLLPLVMFSAIVWGRIAQTVHQGRTLIRRGFGVAEIQSGFRALLDEQAAERAQLRADTKFVKHRRRRELVWVVMLVVAFVLFRWVMNSMRIEMEEGFFTISRPGMVIIYAAFIIAGLSVVNLLRSPLRANIGEHLFRLVWASAIGRAMLSLLGLGVARATTPQTLPPTRPVTAPAAPIHTSKATPATHTATLENRVAALEQWRRETERD